MTIVIRVLYNNQNWKAPCKTPRRNNPCWLCFEDILSISRPSDNCEICDGHCWEQHLCIDYRWGCTPKGRTYGKRAYPGMKAFLIFKQPDGSYTLWGKTTVRSVDEKLVEKGKEYEQGYAFIHFDPFEALPTDKWVKNLSDVDIVGKKWLMGRYRFIDHELEATLERLIDGAASAQTERSLTTSQSTGATNLNINVAPSIYHKLKDISAEEGRQIEEVVREAIAEWLKKRQ